MTVVHNGYYYNRDIWPEKIKEPSSKFLGIDQIFIPTYQIPYDWQPLKNGDVIKNEYGDELIFISPIDGYRLYTNHAAAYLEHWFCEWRLKIKEKFIKA